MHCATVALEDELSSQVDLKVENESRPDVEVREMGVYPNVDCDDDDGALEGFDEWLVENDEAREGQYQMLITDF